MVISAFPLEQIWYMQHEVYKQSWHLGGGEPGWSLSTSQSGHDWRWGELSDLYEVQLTLSLFLIPWWWAFSSEAKTDTGKVGIYTVLTLEESKTDLGPPGRVHTSDNQESCLSCMGFNKLFYFTLVSSLVISAFPLEQIWYMQHEVYKQSWHLGGGETGWSWSTSQSGHDWRWGELSDLYGVQLTLSLFLIPWWWAFSSEAKTDTGKVRYLHSFDIGRRRARLIWSTGQSGHRRQPGELSELYGIQQTLPFTYSSSLVMSTFLWS